MADAMAARAQPRTLLPLPSPPINPPLDDLPFLPKTQLDKLSNGRPRLSILHHLLLPSILLLRGSCLRELSRVAERSRHLLRRRRRHRHHGRRVRLRKPLQPGVRHEHGRAEHRAVQRRAELRRLLRDAVRRRPPAVPPGGVRRGDSHQLLPAQLRPPRRRRRLVQPAQAALRPRRAGVPPDRPVPRRHRARRLPQGAVREEGGHQVHHQRPLLLQPGADHQRGRRWRRARGGRQGVEGRVADDVAQLGAELAEQRLPRRAEPLVPGDGRRRPEGDQLRRGPRRVAVRPDLRGRAVLGLGRGGRMRPPAKCSTKGVREIWKRKEGMFESRGSF